MDINARARIRIIRYAPDSTIAGQMVPSMRNLTGNVAKRMRRLVPKRSFRLNDTITDEGAKAANGRVVGRVTFGGKTIRGVYVGYHLLVERGTSKMRAQPYARPALMQSTSADLKRGA